MRNKTLIQKIAEMVYTGGSVERNGHYNLSKTTFIVTCLELLASGDGKLKEHDVLTWLGWEQDEDTFLSDRDIEVFEQTKAGVLFWDIYHFYSIADVARIEKMVCYTAQHKKISESATHRRREACRYTARKEIRAAVFDRDGEICAHCGATQDLALDHEMPVSKGGEDSLENMQVLCKSCNSTKSDTAPGEDK